MLQVVNKLPFSIGASAAEHHTFSGVGYLTGKRLPEANGIAHAEAGSAARGSAGSEAHTAADCTSQSLGFRLLENQGFGQVAYPRWKAACLRERSTLGRHVHKALAEAVDIADEDSQWSGGQDRENSVSYTLTRSCINYACSTGRTAADYY